MKLVITPKKRLLKWLNNSKLSSKDGHDYYECYIYMQLWGHKVVVQFTRSMLNVLPIFLKLGFSRLEASNYTR